MKEPCRCNQVDDGRQDTGIEFVADMVIDTERASWQDLAYDALNDKHLEQILWELHEVNFRFEFQVLDRCARMDTPFESATDSNIALMECFLEMSFAAPATHTANHGIASYSQQERAHYLFAMARVMNKWKWVSQKGWIAKAHQLSWLPAEIDELEVEIACVYTQSFYNSFRRPPVLPHRLSDNAEKSISSFKIHHPILAPTIVNKPSTIINTAAKL